jgi:hypothetical protein
MTQQKAAYSNTASVLAIIAGSLMVAAAVIILIVGTFIVPHLSEASFPTSQSLPTANVPGFVGSVLQGIGLFGLISGVVVLVSGAMLRTKPSQRTLWGTLMLVFSVLSLFGTGGFVIGAVLGIAGGAKALTWKAPMLQASGNIPGQTV